MPTSQLAKEAIPYAEAEYTNRLLELIKQVMINDTPTGIMRRDAHPKTHAAVKAEFIVEPNLPAELRIGVFKEPKTYQAWIRFSNSADKIKPDIDRDWRGMAIKLMGVPGEKLLPEEKDESTHDFILISVNMFMTKDIEGLFNFIKATKGSLFEKVKFFLTHWNVDWMLYKMFFRTKVKFANPLQIRYFSITPYLFGTDSAVKYSAIPLFRTPDNIPDNPADDYLREAIARQLGDGDAVFDFCVQFQTDPTAMPIEDPRKEWPESVSPFRKVATIRILQQECDTVEQLQFGENMSFTPWHALPEHRPLGGINRGRKVVYEAISKFRHKHNNARRKEPTSWEI